MDKGCRDLQGIVTECY